MDCTSDCIGMESKDHSILCRPINLGTTGVQHVLRSVQRGTPEVRNLLMNECDLIYECKICRSLHRSLANFIAHKRVYCTKHCCESMVLGNNHDVAEDIIVVVPESVQNGSPTTKNLLDQLATCSDPANSNSDIEVIKVLNPPNICAPMGATSEITLNHTDTLENSLSSRERAPDGQHNTAVSSSALKEDWKEIVIQLQSIEGNQNAVYQVVQRGVEEKLPSNPTTRVKAESSSSPAKSNKSSPNARGKRDQFPCCKCGTKFVSLKTLSFHMKNIHAERRVYFPCPYCTAVFSQTWGVGRHLMTVHRKSKDQVSKLRNVILCRAQHRAMTDQGSTGKATGLKGNARGDRTNNGEHSTQGESTSRGDTVTQPCSAVKVEKEEKSCVRCGATFEDDEIWQGHLKICRVQKRIQDRKQPSIFGGVQDTTLVAGNGDGRPKRIVKRKVNEDFVNSGTLNCNTHRISIEGVSAKSDEQTDKQSASATTKMAEIIDIDKRQCKQCGAKFTRLTNLKRHAAQHAGYNRFKCKYCDYFTYIRAQCTMHIRQKHPLKGKRGIQLDKLVVDLRANPNSVNHSVPPVPAPQKTLPVHKSSESEILFRRKLRNRATEGTSAPAQCDTNNSMAEVKFKSTVKRRSGSNFNISTRLSPRTFDTSPYRPSSLSAGRIIQSSFR